jgi:hypothetical protein
MKMYHPDLGWFGWWYDEIHIIIANPVTTTTSMTSAAQTSVSTVATTVTSFVQLQVQDTIIQIVSNSLVSDLIFDSNRGILNFTVTGLPGTIGYFNATIKKSLLQGTPIVNFDGSQIEPTVSEDATFWYIYFTYQHSAHHVTIGGSMVIPEFRNSAFLLVTVSLTMVLFSTRRKRVC